jgi:hypothetical protein
MSDNENDDHVPKLPVLSLKSVDAWGVAPDGSEALINITTATQQLQIHLDYQTLVNLITAAQAARSKAASNAAGSEGQIAVASPVAKFMVGHAAGTKGVLLVLNGETPNETIYAIDHEDAIDMGKMLTAEGQKRRNLSNAIKNVATPPRRRLILPGMQ